MKSIESIGLGIAGVGLATGIALNVIAEPQGSEYEAYNATMDECAGLEGGSAAERACLDSIEDVPIGPGDIFIGVGAWLGIAYAGVRIYRFQRDHKLVEQPVSN